MTRWPKPDAREKLAAALAANPDLTQPEALEITGISRQRLHQLSREMGVYVPPAIRGPAPNSVIRTKAEPIYRGMSPYVASCVAEMAVCLDLLQRNYDVYRSVTNCGACDLVAVHRETERVIRVEVKTARRTASGRIDHAPVKKRNKFDVLALAMGDAGIVYRPDLD